MSKHWKFRSFDPEQVQLLETTAGIPAVLAQIFCAREITNPEQVREFLEPKLTSLRKPETLPGCTEVAQRILDAVREKRKITVYGDSDVDGMTATAILVKAVRLLGDNPDCVNYYIPSRLDDGYGLNDNSLRSLANNGTKVVVTVGCGISACERAKTAKLLGLELLITDHRTPGSELPDADAIANPQLLHWRGKLYSPNDPDVLKFLRTDQNDLSDNAPKGYAFTGLSGAMVAFKVAWALGSLVSGGSKVTPQYQKFLLEATSLATIGTIADTVPLVDENRTLVRFCLEKSFSEHLGEGLRKLVKIAKLDKKKVATSETILFQLAPRFNAAGRMGQAMLGVELLLTNDSKRVKELAEYINNLNESRQKLERKIQKEAVTQIQNLYSPNDAAFVLASNDSQKDETGSKHALKGWHSGIIGLVAGRLAEQYHRPVVVISQDGYGLKQATGAARGIPGFDLYAAFEACQEYLEWFDGHVFAVGLKIKDKNIPTFRSAFVDFCETNISEEVRTSDLWIDAEYPFAVFTFKTVQQMEKLAPFGCENRRPILCSCGVRLESAAKKMGSDGQHFSAMFQQDGVALRGIAFGQGTWVDEMNQYGPHYLFDIAFHVILNSFAGHTKVELQILDWRPSEI